MCKGAEEVQMLRKIHDDLHWVRLELSKLAHQRNFGRWWTPDEEAAYRRLAEQEAWLLRRGGRA